MTKEKKVRKKKKLGSYPFVSVVFSITLALFVVGLFGLMLIMTKQLTTIIQNNVEMQVFLNKGLSKAEIDKITKTLSTKDYINIQEDIPQVEFISKEEAAEQFTKETGEDFVSFLGDNPLRDLLVIKIHPDYQAAQNLVEIKKEIGFIRGVYEVSYVESLASSINENMKKVSLVLIGFSVILFGVVAILINNTIKLALFSQRFLIRSMQLVGATAGFIQKPFLLRSAIYGLIAGLASSGMLWFLLKFANTKIDGLMSLVDLKKLLILGGSILAVGIFVGFMSTFVAIKKYMKLSLDELY